MPSDEEREALADVIDKAMCDDCLGWCGTLADAILAAGFHRQGQITEAMKWAAYEQWRESRDPETASAMWDWLDGWSAALEAALGVERG